MTSIFRDIGTLYSAGDYGTPKGNFPPTAESFLQNPIHHFKEWNLATKKGTRGGANVRGAIDTQERLWVRRANQTLGRLRATYKHIWETCVATLDTENATTIIAGLPYGSGPLLLEQIEEQQQRQTSMALLCCSAN